MATIVTPYFTRAKRGIQTVGATSYIPIGFSGDSGDIFDTATENRVSSQLPENCFVGGFEMELTTAPGVGKSWKFTLRKNGVDTTLFLTISGTSTSASDYQSSISFSAGDLISISAVPTGTPPVTGGLNSQLLFKATNILFICTTTDNTSASWDGAVPRWPGIMGAVGDGPFDVNTNGVPMPTTGTLKNFYCTITAAPGAAKTRNFQLFKNGVAQFTLTFAAADTFQSDITTNVTATPGDLFTYRTSGTGGPATTFASWGCSFVPTDGTDWIPYMVGDLAVNRASTSYQGVIGFGESLTEADVQFKTYGKIDCKNLYLYADSSPGAAKTYEVDVRDDGVTTALTVTLTEPNTTTNNTSDQISMAANSNFVIRTVPTGTPFIAGTSIGYGFLIRWRGRNFGGNTGLFLQHEPSGGNSRKLCD